MQNPTETSAALDAALLAAHEAGDKARMTVLYARAADVFEASGNIDATCFMLTQAYVFALETGQPIAGDLHARLVAYGREE